MPRALIRTDWRGLALPNQLGRDEPNATTFLRGDRRWVVPTGTQRYVNVQASPYLAVGDGVTDDAAAIQAAIEATPIGGTLYLPRTNNYYRVLSTPTINKVIHLMGDGWRLQAGGLTGSIIRQEGGLTNDAFFIDATAGELDGLLIENIALGTTSNGRHALHLGANVNRSVFRNIFLAGAVESAFKQATPGNHILNHYENIRISMGFVSVLGYAIPKRGFDLGAGSTSVFLNCGVAGVTTAPGIGWDLANGPISNFFYFPESEGNTIGWNFGGAASGNILFGSYHEANGTTVGGSSTTPNNLSITSGGDSTAGVEFPATVGLTIKANVMGTSDPFVEIPAGTLLANTLLAPFLSGPARGPRGSIHASRTGVSTLYDGTADGDVPLFAHADTNTDKVAIQQWVATGALADVMLSVGATGGDAAFMSRNWSAGAQTGIRVRFLKVDVIATASLPAAAAAQDGRIVIEDNGAGDRNVIIYAGGERFRLDGGTAF